MVDISIKLKLKDGTYLEFDKQEIKNIESLSQSTPDASSIFYGIVSSSGSIEILDYDDDIYNYIQNKLIDVSSIDIDIYINNNIVFKHVSSNSEYLINERILKITITDILLSWKNISVAEITSQNELNAYELLSNIFSTININDIDSFLTGYTLDKDTNWVSIKTYLQSIRILHPYLPSASFYDDIEKVCVLAQLNCRLKDDGTIVFENARPIDSLSNVINIPKRNQYSKLNYSILLKNLYDTVEYNSYSVDLSTSPVSVTSSECFVLDYTKSIFSIYITEEAIHGSDRSYLEIRSNIKLYEYDKIYYNEEEAVVGEDSSFYDGYWVTDINVDNDGYFYATQRQWLHDITLYRANTHRDINLSKNIINIKTSEIFSNSTWITAMPIPEIFCYNIFYDYRDGISDANITVSFSDYYDTNNNKVIDGSLGQILKVGDIVKIEGIDKYWRITSRKLRKKGCPFLDLNLIEVKDAVHKYSYYSSLVFSTIDYKTSVSAANTTISGDIVIPQYVIVNKRVVTPYFIDDFHNCTLITSVDIPKGAVYIANSAFIGCSNLISVNIPDTVKTISNNAFKNCSSLIQIDLPDEITDIYSETFAGCNSLQSIKLPKNLTRINDAAFSNCSSLTSIKIPSSVNYIASYSIVPALNVFYRCTNLIEVTVDSLYVYNNLTSNDALGFLAYNATTINILASIDDGSNTFLNNNYTVEQITIDGVEYNSYTTT